MKRKPTIIEAIENPKLFGSLPRFKKLDLGSVARGLESNLRSSHDRRRPCSFQTSHRAAVAADGWFERNLSQFSGMSIVSLLLVGNAWCDDLD
jgi:hypothetical protein